MDDQLFDSFRKASESSLQMQQEMLKQWTERWAASAAQAPNAASDASQQAQKRWLALGLELLEKHRASLDSTYAAGIQLIAQSFRTTEAKSSDEYRRLTEDLWRKLFDTYKSQTEAQFDAFKTWSTKSAEAVQDART
ncbi:MAG TPA: hypothetical protein VLC06_28875 [Polyangia bacterium]|jgi:hypothetical protein|nr:hypothetical protein [Polyangia bacterium]